MKRKSMCIVSLLAALFLLLSGCTGQLTEPGNFPVIEEGPQIDPAEIPAYSGSPYTVLNDDMPDFEESDYTTHSYEHYSELDALGRCRTASACIGKDLMPSEERGAIGAVKPLSSDRLSAERGE